MHIQLKKCWVKLRRKETKEMNERRKIASRSCAVRNKNWRERGDGMGEGEGGEGDEYELELSGRVPPLRAALIGK